VIGPERFFPDRQRALEERLGIAVTALVLVESCQTLQRRRDIGVVGPERPFVDR
jgi:hypothetical protein